MDDPVLKALIQVLATELVKAAAKTAADKKTLAEGLSVIRRFFVKDKVTSQVDVTKSEGEILPSLFERISPAPGALKVGEKYHLPESGTFIRKDKTATQIANEWFRRTGSRAWSQGPGAAVNAWLAHSPKKRLPYFTAEHRLRVDYDAPTSPRARHPLLRVMTPFILVTTLDRQSFGGDPVGEIAEEFENGWRSFTTNGYLEFGQLTDAILGGRTYGFKSGVFAVKPYEFNLGKSTLQKSAVQLYRAIIILRTLDEVSIVHFGSPLLDNNPNLVGDFAHWLKDFKINY